MNAEPRFDWWSFAMGLIVGLAMAGALLVGAVIAAQARPLADFHNPPSVTEWFKSARNGRGEWCCNDADRIREGIAHPWGDGDRVIFTQWELRATGYWVEVVGRWVQVPEGGVVRGNPVGAAVVWLNYVNGAPVVRCFAPTSES